MIFTSLEPGVDYIVESAVSYDQNNGKQRVKVELDSLQIGVFTRLDVSYEAILGEAIYSSLV